MAFQQLRELALFAGAGGGILGGKLLGWRTRCAVEIDSHCRKVLLQRQKDGILEPFPTWDDVTTFDGKPWKGSIDIITGGFPCQDISAAGKGQGIEGERSGLWSEMARIIGEVQPRYALVENSPLLVSRGLDIILSDFAEMGYDGKWGVISAENAGAPHKRQRIWILAYPMLAGELRGKRKGKAKKNVMAHANGQRELQPERAIENKRQWSGYRCEWWDTDPADLPHADCRGPQERSRQYVGKMDKEKADISISVEGQMRGAPQPELGRVAHGVADRVDRLKAIGNGQVPAVVALAWDILKPDNL